MDRRAVIHSEAMNDLPAYVLGVLEPEERDRIAEHVATCPHCQIEHRRLEVSVDALWAAAPQVEPPTTLRSRILTSIEDDLDGHVVPPAMPRWIRPILAAAAIIVLALASWVTVLTHDLTQTRSTLSQVQASQNQAREILAEGSQSIRLAEVNAPRAYGMLYLSSQPQHAVLVVNDLPPSQAGHVYQIWLYDSTGSAISAGIFSTDSDGNATVALETPAPINRFTTMGITVEPGPGGSNWPTGQKLVGCNLSS